MGFPDGGGTPSLRKYDRHKNILLGCRSHRPLWPTLIGLTRNSFPDTSHSTGPASEARAYESRREAGLDFDVLGKKRKSPSEGLSFHGATSTVADHR